MIKTTIIPMKYQLKAVIKFCCVFLLAVVLSSIVIYLKLDIPRGKDYYDILSSIRSARELLLPTVILSLLIQIISGVLFTIIVLTFISHKVAGPFYRFDKIFEGLSSSDLTLTLQLRDGDELKSLADQVTKMIGGLRERITALKYSCSEFSAVGAQFSAHIEGDMSDTEFREKAESLDESCSRMKKSLSEFEI